MTSFANLKLNGINSGKCSYHTSQNSDKIKSIIKLTVIRKDIHFVLLMTYNFVYNTTKVYIIKSYASRIIVISESERCGNFLFNSLIRQTLEGQQEFALNKQIQNNIVHSQTLCLFFKHDG